MSNQPLKSIITIIEFSLNVATNIGFTLQKLSYFQRIAFMKLVSQTLTPPLLPKNPLGGGIDLLYGLRAVADDGAGVDGAFVGDLAEIKARRVAQHQHMGDAGRAARRCGGKAGVTAGQFLHDTRAVHHAFCGEEEGCEGGAVLAQYHRVADQAAEMVDQTRAQGTDGDPCSGGEFEILGDAAVEEEALGQVIGISGAQGVA